MHARTEAFVIKKALFHFMHRVLLYCTYFHLCMPKNDTSDVVAFTSPVIVVF